MLNVSLRSAHLRPALEPALSPLTLDWNLAFAREPNKQACAYWLSLCEGRKMPRREELRPIRMRRFLQHVNLVGVVREGTGSPDFMMSLEGQHVRDIYGPIANRKLHDVLPPQVEQRWRYAFSVVAETARPARFFSSISTGANSCLRGECLIAPLGEESLGVESLFAVIATWQHTGEQAGPSGDTRRH